MTTETQTDYDPFATPTPAPAPAAPDPTASPPPAASVGSSRVRMSFKSGSGPTAPWLVIDTVTVQEANTVLADAQALKQLFDRSAKAGGYYASLGAGSAPAAPVQQPGPQTAPGGETRYCAHGEMSYQTKVSRKTGKPYSAFFCPSTDRDNQCPIQFPDNKRGGGQGGQQYDRPPF